MTNKNRRDRVRAYMAEHGVNYTTALRAVGDGSGDGLVSAAVSPARCGEPLLTSQVAVAAAAPAEPARTAALLGLRVPASWTRLGGQRAWTEEYPRQGLALLSGAAAVLMAVMAFMLVSIGPVELLTLSGATGVTGTDALGQGQFADLAFVVAVGVFLAWMMAAGKSLRGRSSSGAPGAAMQASPA